MTKERERGGKIERILNCFFFSSFPQTPLHWAAYGDSAKCVNTLIHYGADMEAKTVMCESVRLTLTEEEMCGDMCDLLTDVCLGVGVWPHLQKFV